MSQPVYEFRTFSLDVAEHRLSNQGRPVALTPKVFDVLRMLVENSGHLVYKERLLREVWNGEFVEEANLNRAVSVLRKALGETPTDRYIETVPKLGYRFVAPVRERPHPLAPVAPQVAAAHSAEEKTDGTRRLPIPSLLWGAAVSLVVAGLTAAAVLYLSRSGASPESRVTAPGDAIHRQLTFTGKEITPTLSPDGRRIAYVSNESPHRKIVVQEIDGGQPIVVFSAPEASALRWSRDSSELLLWARGEGTDGLYIASRSGGPARKVAKSPAVTCWSPDGSTIAVALFVPQKILFLNRLGEEQRTITLQGSRDWIWDMDWSPVHDRLLFVATDDSRRAAIWSIRSDGSGQTKLLSSDSEISAARWAPAGDAVYYFKRVKQMVSVFKASASPDFAATQPAQALISGLEGDGSYGLSADASRIVYARAPYYSNLWLVEADPKSPKPTRTMQLTRGTSVIERPRVSPDGQAIVFNMGYESHANLYTMPAAGGPARQLTFLNGFNLAGVWSPDGTSVAFASSEGGAPRLWTVKTSGGSPSLLPSSDVSENFNLAWAPGSRILYQKTGYKSYHAVDPGTGQQQVPVPDEAYRFACCPEYSPDGERIAVYLSRPRRGLWAMNKDGSGQILIHALVPKADSNPFPIGWSSDGRSIYAYDGKRAAARGLSVAFGETVTAARIVRIPIDGGPPATVVDLPFEEVGGVAIFPDGRRVVASVYTSRSDVWLIENFEATSGRIARRDK